MEPSSELSGDLEGYFVKPCPLCNDDVRYCLISLTEKVLMCVNVYCDYPFGYEDLQFSPLEFEVSIEAAKAILARQKSELFSVTSSLASSDIDKFNKVLLSEQSQLFNLDEAPENSNRTLKFDYIRNKKLRKELEDLEYQITKLNVMGRGAEHNASKSFCTTSSLASSDIDKFNKVFKSEESELLSLDVAPKYSNEKSKSDFVSEKLAKDVEDLKTLTNELNKIKLAKTDKADIIKNQKWLENLMKLQGSSGRKLLKKEEMELLEGNDQHVMMMD